jgi:hypothetical protein
MFVVAASAARPIGLSSRSRRTLYWPAMPAGQSSLGGRRGALCGTGARNYHAERGTRRTGRQPTVGLGSITRRASQPDTRLPEAPRPRTHSRLRGSERYPVHAGGIAQWIEQRLEDLTQSRHPSQPLRTSQPTCGESPPVSWWTPHPTPFDSAHARLALVCSRPGALTRNYAKVVEVLRCGAARLRADSANRTAQ